MKRLAIAAFVLLTLCAWTQAAVVSNQTLNNVALQSGNEYVSCVFRGKIELNGNVTVRNSKVDNASLYVKGSNNKILNNELWGGLEGAYFNNRPMIFTEGTDGLVIEGNLFRDGQYAIIGFHWNKLRLANNTFVNVYQGAHILAPKDDCYIGGNVARGLVRMMFEVQSHGGSVSNNLLVEKNVASAWRRVFNDSFFLSIVPDGGNNTRVIDNHCEGTPNDYNGPWENPTNASSRRMGFGIEFGSRSGEVSRNVIAGKWAVHICVSGGGTNANATIPVRDNKLYGQKGVDWGGFIKTESGPVNVQDVNNVKDENFNNRPPLPGALPPATQPVPPPATQPAPVTMVGSTIKDVKTVTTITVEDEYSDGTKRTRIITRP
jgi:hypothetical protein